MFGKRTDSLTGEVPEQSAVQVPGTVYWRLRHQNTMHKNGITCILSPHLMPPLLGLAKVITFRGQVGTSFRLCKEEQTQSGRRSGSECGGRRASKQMSNNEKGTW